MAEDPPHELSAEEVRQWCRLKDQEASLRKAASKAIDEEPKSADWQAEYNFWHKIITEEVERHRFNDGYEPIEVDLYPVKKQKGVPGPDYVGSLQIGHQKFRATAQRTLDAQGNKIFRFSILTEPKK